MRPRLKQLSEGLKQLTSMTFQQQDTTRWLFLTPGQRRQWRKVGDGSSSSVVTAPLLWIGRNFPEAPPALWQKTGDSGEEERVTGQGNHGGDHPMLELMEHPNEYYSGPTLWQATVLDYHLSGNGYWLKLRDRGGRPYELWWVPSGLIRPQGDEKTFISYYEYRVGGQTINVDPENVVHFRYNLDPEDPRKGRSPLAALLQEVFTDQEAADFTAALLGNMGVPGVVVSPAKGGPMPTPGDVTATKEYLKGGFTGEKRGEPLVMSGPTSVEQFGFNPQQLTLRELRRLPEERVTACLGVPAIVAGLGAGLDRSTFANFAEAREAAYQDNIIPAQRIISEDVRWHLLPDFEPEGAWKFRFGFDLSGVRVLQEDLGDQVTRLNTGIVGGWVRVSEGRRALDLDVDDADEVYLRPVSSIEVPAGEAGNLPASLLSPGSSETEPASPGSEEKPPEEEPSQEEQQTNQRKKMAEDMKRFTRLQAQLIHALERNRRALESAFAREIESDLLAYGEACEHAFLHMAPAMAGRNGGNEHTKAIDATQIARMVVLTLSSAITETLKKRFQTHAKRVIDETSKTISDIANFDAGVSDTAQMQILQDAGKRIGLVDIDNSTRNAIFNAIDQGNQLGQNPREIARSIREQVPSGPFVNAGPAYRSQLISRTETNWAMNTSAIASYRENDNVTGCIAMDGSGDPECAERNGKEYSFDDAQDELEQEHPNGTLTFAPVIGELVPA
jgi:HK97 family phage portal protein